MPHTDLLVTYVTLLGASIHNSEPPYSGYRVSGGGMSCMGASLRDVCKQWLKVKHNKYIDELTGELKEFPVAQTTDLRQQ